MATVSIMDALDSILREEISQGLREQRVKLDPVWTEIISTSMGVVREGIGRDWQFEHAFTTGSAGAFSFLGSPQGPNSEQAVDYTYLNNPGQGFPGRLESVLPSFFLRKVALKEGRGNVFVPLKWWTMDKFTGAVGSAIKAVVSGVTRKIARAYSINMYLKDADNGKIVDNIPATADAATYTITIDNADANAAHGRIQMLEPGMVVDVYKADGTTILPTAAAGVAGPLVITKVDYLNQKFTIAHPLGTSMDWTPALGAAPFTMVLRGTIPKTTHAAGYQPAGLNTWIKAATASPTVFNIAFADHPEHGSLVDSSQSGPLTEAILRNKIGSFIDRAGSMVDLDTIITPAGVVHAYMENEDNLMTIERNGRLMEIKAGWAEITFTYHGKPYRWAISTFCESGAVYVLKLGENNIKEYLPPSTPGTGSDKSFGDVEFIGPAGGLSGIWMHDRLTATEAESVTPFGQVGGPSDFLNAPFFRISEVCPDMMPSIKLTTFDESY